MLWSHRLIRGNMWCKVLNIADLFCLHGNIRPWNTTISLFFGALKLFFWLFLYFQLRSVGYIALYKLKFQNWQHWKCLIPRGPFKGQSGARTIDLPLSKQAALTTAPGPGPYLVWKLLETIYIPFQKNTVLDYICQHQINVQIDGVCMKTF